MRLRIRPAADTDLDDLVAIHNAAAQADDTGQFITRVDLEHALRHPAGLEPSTVITVAVLEGLPVGYHRLQAFSDPDGLQIYSHRGFVHPDWRGRGTGGALIDRAEQALTSLAGTYRAGPAVLSAWAYETEVGASGLLERRGYQPHRQMLEMTRSLFGQLPAAPLPADLEIRPAHADRLPMIWDAYLEASADDVGAVAGTGAAYNHWLAMPQWGDRSLWQVAWAGDQVAGMVLNYWGPVAANQPRRSHTEYVNVRRPWRRRGLATALLARSLAVFAELGAREVTLDVNEANPSNAASVYAKLGYVVRRRIEVYRRQI